MTSANPKALSSDVDDSYFGMFDTALSYIMDSEEENFLDRVHDSNTKFTALQAYQSVDKHILNTCKTKNNTYNPLNDPEENEQVVNNPSCSEKFNKHNNIMTSLNFYMESLRDCLKITQDKTRILHDESFRNGQATETLQKINNSSMKYAGKYEKMALEEDGLKIQPEVIKED